MQAVFDGHNDVLERLYRHRRTGIDPVAEFIQGTARLGLGRRAAGHIDLPRARAGGLVGGLCAIYLETPGFRIPHRRSGEAYEAKAAGRLDQAMARRIALDMVGMAEAIAAAGGWRLCRDVADIRAAMAAGAFAAVLHLEGAEPIDRDFAVLHELYGRGLRSLGPVWSRDNAFGFGVPFKYPAGPDIGEGLTDLGKGLVRACDELGIMVDLAHLNEKGFWDVARLSSRPLVATHSNVHALCPVARNLTDRQLDAIGASGGVVGLNFATGMLDAHGSEDTELPLSVMVDHIRHLVDRVGIDGVALGSDFDGAPVPAAIGDAAGLPSLVAALSGAGFGEAELVKLCRENWLRVLGHSWGPH